MAKGKSAKKRKKAARTAATSDRYDLYERSVQDPSGTCDFVERVFAEHDRPRPRSLREDFCGTGRNSVEWVRRHRENTAVGVDLDPEVIEVAERHVRKRLKKKKRDRIRFVRKNALTVKEGLFDCVVAFNFSYFCLRNRKLLRRYFRSVRRSLTDDGLFLLDAYGGSDAHLEVEEPREVEDFTYVWDQYRYDPITAHVVNAIHFRFRDGTALESAFVYDWRLWSLPEIRDLLEEAGFSSVSFYFEDIDDDTLEGTGEWRIRETGDPIEGWVANLVAAP